MIGFTKSLMVLSAAGILSGVEAEGFLWFKDVEKVKRNSFKRKQYKLTFAPGKRNTTNGNVVYEIGRETKQVTVHRGWLQRCLDQHVLHPMAKAEQGEDNWKRSDWAKWRLKNARSGLFSRSRWWEKGSPSHRDENVLKIRKLFAASVQHGVPKNHEKVFDCLNQGSKGD